MIDPDTIKTIAVIAGATYTAVVKSIDVYRSKKKEKQAETDVKHNTDLYSDFDTRLEEFEDLIELPEDTEDRLPGSIRDLIMERNYYRVMCQYLKRKCEDREGKGESIVRNTVTTEDKTKEIRIDSKYSMEEKTSTEYIMLERKQEEE